MYQNCCKKCGSISLHTETKGNNVGLYCNDCKMNEVKGIYGGCLDCEDCKDGDLHCEDCSMFEKETK